MNINQSPSHVDAEEQHRRALEELKAAVKDVSSAVKDISSAAKDISSAAKDISSAAKDMSSATNNVYSAVKGIYSAPSRPTSPEDPASDSTRTPWSNLEKPVREYDEHKIKARIEKIDNLLIFVGLMIQKLLKLSKPT